MKNAPFFVFITCKNIRINTDKHIKNFVTIHIKNLRLYNLYTVFFQQKTKFIISPPNPIYKNTFPQYKKII